MVIRVNRVHGLKHGDGEKENGSNNGPIGPWTPLGTHMIGMNNMCAQSVKWLAAIHYDLFIYLIQFVLMVTTYFL